MPASEDQHPPPAPTATAEPPPPPAHPEPAEKGKENNPPASADQPASPPKESAEKKREEETQKKPKRGGMGRFWLIVLGLAVVLGVLLALGILPRFGREKQRQQSGEAQQRGARTVRVAKTQRSPTSFDFSLPGSAEALTTTTLYARTNGYLRERLADIGDRVEAGQLLARIEAPDVDAQLRQTQATLEQQRASLAIAKVTFERQKKLLAERVVSQQEYDQNEATYRQAEANVKAAEANVQNLTVQQGFQRITAPFSGVITARYLNVGDLINAGSSTAAPSLFQLSQTDLLRVYIYVPQAYSANVQPGQEVAITAPQYPGKTFKGRVTRTADALDPAARTERVEIQLPSENGQLLPGSYLTTRFVVAQAEPAQIVPSSTLDIAQDGTRVAVVTPDKKIRFQKVTLGRDFGTTIEVTNGLKGDEQLVVEPSTDLRDGEPVEIAKPDDKKDGGGGGQNPPQGQGQGQDQKQPSGGNDKGSAPRG